MKMFFVMNLVAISCCSGLLAADNTLTEAEKQDGWTLMFNGKDFSDWQIDKWNPESFSIEDGAIKCHGKPSMIYYDGEGKEMKDFHFVADVMTKPGANGGIFFHTKYQDRGWPVGHEAQIDNSHTDPVRTGSIYIDAKTARPGQRVVQVRDHRPREDDRDESRWQDRPDLRRAVRRPGFEEAVFRHHRDSGP